MEISYVNNSRRLAKNTLLLYFRLLVGMLISFYTSRAVLQALGVDGYGIYEVVAGFVVFFSIISSSLSSAVSRFITFELGKGDMRALRRVFSASLSIHVVLALVVILLTETFGLWYVNNVMVLPAGRLYAANWVYQASVFTFVVSLVQVPYVAELIAHEHMNMFAYMGILNVVLKLLIVLFLIHVSIPFDNLIVYAVMLALVGLGIQFVYYWYCKKHFDECRAVRLSYDKAQWREVSTFAGWNFIGSSAVIVKQQGIILLLNAFFGVVINTARGMSMMVNTACTSFASAFMTALNPQITKSYSVGDMPYVFSLVDRGSRFSFYLIMILMIPIMLESDFVLFLWLNEHIPHLTAFVRLILIVSLIEILSNSLNTLQLATGDIRSYQLAVGGMAFLEIPLSYVALRFFSAPPEAVYVVSLFIAVVCLWLRLVFVKRATGLPIGHFLINVCLRALCITVLSALPPFLVYSVMTEGWLRFITVTSVSIIFACIIVFFLGCTKSERRFIIKSVMSVRDRLS